MRNEDFIKQRLIDESQNLLDAEFYFPVFLLISQGIETLGCFLDKKPLGAKSQSKKRFHLAIDQLFENKYQELTDRDWLYKQFRCNMSHLATTGGFIILARFSMPRHCWMAQTWLHKPPYPRHCLAWAVCCINIAPRVILAQSPGSLAFPCWCILQSYGALDNSGA